MQFKPRKQHKNPSIKYCFPNWPQLILSCVTADRKSLNTGSDDFFCARRISLESKEMEEMAVNNQVSWHFPLSPTLRDNDCFEPEQADLFQNLEKLIASAVSICRLNGSLQCQIGGLITVIEELRRLLRYSFSEIKKLEKSLDHQKHNSTSKISNLQKQVEILESSVVKCKSSDVIAPPSVIHEEPCITPRSSSNSEQCIFQGENDVSQFVEEMHVSLVDESYGNEESDNNLDDQADDTEDDKVVVLHCANGETTSIDLSNGASFEDKNEGDAEDSASRVETAEKHLEGQSQGQSQGSSDTISSDHTFEFSIIETTSDVSDESMPRNLRNSKQMIDSKSSGEDLSSKRRKCRSERPSEDNHELIEDSLPKKRGRKPKTSSQDNDFMRKDQKRGNRIRMTSASAVGKGSLKIKAVPKNRRDFKRKERGQKSNGSNQNSEKPTIVNWPSLHEIKMETDVDTTVPETKEKLVDRDVNLDFLLTVNQVMSDLVSDEDQEEAALDQVNEHERKEVLNLAKLYRLRVRMARKCEGELPVVLVKGRESCLPKPGEVDSLLSIKSDTFHRRQAGVSRKSGNKHILSMVKNSSALNQNARSKK